MSERLVGATTDLLTVVQDKFLPNSEKFMYQFNLRELCNIMQVRALGIIGLHTRGGQP
jgi:hypothetical protein